VNFIIHGNYRAYSAFSDDFGVEYDFDSTTVNSDKNFSPFPSPAGTGIGFDFGVSAQVSDKWKLAASVTGIGHIKWEKNVAEYSSDEAIIIEDISDESELDSLFDKVKGEGRYINQVQTDLPLVLRLGASLEVHELLRKIPFPEPWLRRLIIIRDSITRQWEPKGEEYLSGLNGVRLKSFLSEPAFHSAKIWICLVSWNRT